MTFEHFQLREKMQHQLSNEYQIAVSQKKPKNTKLRMWQTQIGHATLNL